VVADMVDEVIAPGSEGYFGVLRGHAPFLTTLGVGELTYRKGRDEYHLAIAGGFAEVRNDKVIILAASPDRPAQIDRDLPGRARADRARQRAEQPLAGRGQEESDYARCAAALGRALTRLHVAGRSQ